MLIPDPDPGTTDDSFVAVGFSHHDYIPVRQYGELSDRDLNSRGTIHSFMGIQQVIKVFDPQDAAAIGTLHVGIVPPMDEQDLNSLILTFDGH